MFLVGYEKFTSLLFLDPSFLPVNLPGGRGFLKGSKSEVSADNLPGGFLNASASTSFSEVASDHLVVVEVALEKRVEVLQALTPGFTGQTFCSQTGFLSCIPELHELNVEVMKFNSSYPGCLVSVNHKFTIITGVKHWKTF